MHVHPYTPRQQQWRTVWPAGIVGALAATQLALNVVIVASETVSLIADPYHSMIFAGYFCSLFFFVTWISMFTVACCNQHSTGCATHVLVENILSIIAASVLLYYDRLFLSNPFTCIFGSVSNCGTITWNWNDHDSTAYTGIYNRSNYDLKMAMIKVQLGCGVVMQLTCVTYVAIYIRALIRTRAFTNAVVVQAFRAAPMATMAQMTMGTYPPAYPMNFRAYPQQQHAFSIQS